MEPIVKPLTKTPITYSHAPLTEALITFAVALPAATGVDKIAAVQQGIEAEYPRKSMLFQSQLVMSVDSQAMATSASQKPYGHRFDSADGLQVLQAKMDGFTFSRLEPYENWPKFSREARRLWEKYRATLMPLSISRIGVRYINRLNLPANIRDFREYLNTLPEVAGPIDTGLAEFLMRLVVVQDDIDATLVLTEALLPPSLPGQLSLLLDIELGRVAEWDPFDDDAVWGYLAELAVRKNDIFEACITDRVREMIR